MKTLIIWGKPSTPQIINRIEKWSAYGKVDTLHELTAARLQQEDGYYDTRHKVLWWNLYNGITDVVIPTTTILEFRFPDDYAHIFQWCYFHGIYVHLWHTQADKLILVRPFAKPYPRKDPAKDKEIAEINEKHTPEVARKLIGDLAYPDAGVFYKELRSCNEWLEGHEQVAYNQKEYERIVHTFRKTTKQLKEVGFEIPEYPAQHLLLQEVYYNARPYDIPELIPEYEEFKPSFFNSGSLKEANWQVTNFHAMHPLSIYNEDNPCTVTMYLAYLLLMYYKSIGYEPDTTKFYKCEVCGQWTTKEYATDTDGYQHCIRCDNPSIPEAILLQRDFLEPLYSDDDENGYTEDTSEDTEDEE